MLLNFRMLLKFFVCLFVFVQGTALELGVMERWKQISWFGRKAMVAVNTGHKGN